MFFGKLSLHRFAFVVVFDGAWIGLAMICLKDWARVVPWQLGRSAIGHRLTFRTRYAISDWMQVALRGQHSLFNRLSHHLLLNKTFHIR